MPEPNELTIVVVPRRRRGPRGGGGGGARATGVPQLARYPLDASLSTRGLIFCRLLRMHTGDAIGKDEWSLEALGLGCDGRKADEEETLRVGGGCPRAPRQDDCVPPPFGAASRKTMEGESGD